MVLRLSNLAIKLSNSLINTCRTIASAEAQDRSSDNYFYTKLLYFIITYFYYAAIISNVSFHYTTSIVNKIKNINNISCSILYIAMYIRKYTHFVLNSNVYKNSVIFLLYRHWHSFYSYALFIYYSCIKF
jgi:hypothetical protein